MGSTQQGQAVVEMVLVGSFKKLERQTHRDQTFRKILQFSETLIFWAKNPQKPQQGLLKNSLNGLDDSE